MSDGAGTIEVLRLDEVDSTNLEARRWAASVPAGAGALAIVAERQTAGVGRFGRRWHSPEGGLWMTLAWPVEGDERAVLEGLGLRVGVACLRAVERALEGAAGAGPVELKWPNDVLIGGEKVCGSLTESVRESGRLWLIVGVGINVNNDPAELPPGLRTAATSLKRQTGAGVSIDGVLGVLLAELSRAIAWRSGDGSRFFDGVSERLRGVGETVVIAGPDRAERRAVLVGIDGLGRLLVRWATTDEVETLGPGCEVVWPGRHAGVIG